MSELQQSPNWEKFKDNSQPVRVGFPFDEGWPDVGPAEGKVFEIIDLNGEKYKAFVDFSTQYRAEGLNWKTLRGETVYKSHVIAWKELP